MMIKGLCLYPNIPREDVIAGLTALYPGTLSWSHGVTKASRSDGDLVYYKVQRGAARLVLESSTAMED
jgi:hypothetical protein